MCLFIANLLLFSCSYLMGNKARREENMQTLTLSCNVQQMSEGEGAGHKVWQQHKVVLGLGLGGSRIGFLIEAAKNHPWVWWDSGQPTPRARGDSCWSNPWSTAAPGRDSWWKFGEKAESLSRAKQSTWEGWYREGFPFILKLMNCSGSTKKDKNRKRRFNFRGQWHIPRTILNYEL